MKERKKERKKKGRKKEIKTWEWLKG